MSHPSIFTPHLLRNTTPHNSDMAVIAILQYKQAANSKGLRCPKENLIPHTFVGFLMVPGCPRGGGTWETLRIPREDWGTLGNIRED